MEWLPLLVLLFWPFVYAWAVMSFPHPTVPDRVYLNTVKPIAIGAQISAYLWFARKAVRSPVGRFGRRLQTIIYPACTIALIMILLLEFTDIYKLLGIIDPYGHTVHDGASCLYFSVITWTTVGYGDFHPTPSARGFVACEAMLGYLLMGLLVALFTNAVLESRAPSR